MSSVILPDSLVVRVKEGAGMSLVIRLWWIATFPVVDCYVVSGGPG